MCHPANYNKKFEMRRARRVVRKYRRLSYRKQMLRLRSLLDCEDKVEEAEVLESRYVFFWDHHCCCWCDEPAYYPIPRAGCYAGSSVLPACY